MVLSRYFHVFGISFIISSSKIWFSKFPFLLINLHFPPDLRLRPPTLACISRQGCVSSKHAHDGRTGVDESFAHYVGGGISAF